MAPFLSTDNLVASETLSSLASSSTFPRTRGSQRHESNQPRQKSVIVPYFSIMPPPVKSRYVRKGEGHTLHQRLTRVHFVLLIATRLKVVVSVQAYHILSNPSSRTSLLLGVGFRVFDKGAVPSPSLEQHGFPTERVLCARYLLSIDFLRCAC